MPATKPVQQVELVDIGTLTPHPDNARQGDVGAICTSIAVNGWYGAVIVSRRSTGDVIVAGEHRWRALAALQADGWTEENGNAHDYAALKVADQVPDGKVPVIALADLDETAERKILLADNRSNDIAAYDDARLAELLASLAEAGDLTGTLYSGDDVDQLLAELNIEVRLSPSAERSLNDRAAVYNDGHVRQIVVVLTPDEFAEANVILDAAREQFEVGTHSDAAFEIWKAWAAEHAPDT